MLEMFIAPEMWKNASTVKPYKSPRIPDGGVNFEECAYCVPPPCAVARPAGQTCWGRCATLCHASTPCAAGPDRALNHGRRQVSAPKTYGAILERCEMLMTPCIGDKEGFGTTGRTQNRSSCRSASLQRVSRHARLQERRVRGAAAGVGCVGAGCQPTQPARRRCSSACAPRRLTIAPLHPGVGLRVACVEWHQHRPNSYRLLAVPGDAGVAAYNLTVSQVRREYGSDLLINGVLFRLQ